MRGAVPLDQALVAKDSKESESIVIAPPPSCCAPDIVGRLSSP